VLCVIRAHNEKKLTEVNRKHGPIATFYFSRNSILSSTLKITRKKWIPADTKALDISKFSLYKSNKGLSRFVQQVNENP